MAQKDVLHMKKALGVGRTPTKAIFNKCSDTLQNLQIKYFGASPNPRDARILVAHTGATIAAYADRFNHDQLVTLGKKVVDLAKKAHGNDEVAWKGFRRNNEDFQTFIQGFAAAGGEPLVMEIPELRPAPNGHGTPAGIRATIGEDERLGAGSVR